jgi:hypothetical protein
MTKLNNGQASADTESAKTAKNSQGSKKDGKQK